MGRVLAWGLLMALLPFGRAAAQPAAPALRRESLAERSVDVAAWSHWRRLLRLEDYNTRIVLLGTSLLGLAAGTIGSFTLLRKRALIGDALSHAMLPGIALAFLLSVAWGHAGKSLPILLAGAAISGLVGMAVILFIRHLTRLHEDTALGIVLSVFFGAGVALLGIVQQMSAGHAAGLEAFIFGKTASMVASDAWLIGGAGLSCTIVCLLLFKELRLLSFDDQFARSRGFPVVVLDVLLIGLVVVVTIVGLQAVGLILMIALLIIPAAAARFWTERMTWMMAVAAALGAVSALVGAAMSAVFPKLPSGAMIVLVAAALFLLSMLLAPARGVLARWLRRRQLQRRIDRQHVLRGMYEWMEARGGAAEAWGDRADPPEQTLPPVTSDELLATRSWSPRRLGRAMSRARRSGLVRRETGGAWRLTPVGLHQAARVVREHRLWELYLITYADVAAGNVDRGADVIEHVLDQKTIDRLEAILDQRRMAAAVIASPHPIALATREADRGPRDGER